MKKLYNKVWKEFNFMINPSFKILIEVLKAWLFKKDVIISMFFYADGADIYINNVIFGGKK